MATPDWIRRMTAANDAFEEWAGKHEYLPIVERDFRACWNTAWGECEGQYNSLVTRLYNRIAILEARIPAGDNDWMKHLK